MAILGTQVLLGSGVSGAVDQGFLIWLAYHRSLGLNDIQISLPQSKSPPDPILLALEQAKVITLTRLPSEAGDAFETAALTQTMAFAAAPTGLALMLPVDEFLLVQDAKQTQQALAQADAMAIPVLGPTQTPALRCLFHTGRWASHTGAFVTRALGNKASVWVDSAGVPIAAPSHFSPALPCPRNPVLIVHKAALPVMDLATHDLFVSGPLAPARRATQEHLQQLLALPGIRAALDNDPTQGSGQEPAKDPNPAPKPEAPPADRFDQVLSDPPPPWFIEIYPGGEARGFYRRLKHHALLMIERDSPTLVVTFDNLSSVNDRSFGRLPWGYKLLADLGHAHLGVMAMRKDWYREASLIAALEALATEGLFARFDRVVMAGTSMGGFGAMAFASLSPGASVLAMSPQSTLNEALVPWETRFELGRKRNWRLPYSDCVYEIEEATQVTLISDPYHALDQAHIDRLQGDNITRLKSWYTGHYSPVFMQRAEILKPLVVHAIEGTLTEDIYYKLYRARRRLPWYARSLTEQLQDRGRTDLAARVMPAFRNSKRLRPETALR